MVASFAKAFANLWLFWLVALAAITWFKLWRARSSITDILRSSPNATMRAERIQNLALFLLVLGGYAATALRFLLDPDRPSLPDAPTTLLAILGGSNGIYLVKKALDTRPSAQPQES